MTGYKFSNRICSELTGRPNTTPTRERVAAQRLALHRCIDLVNQTAELRGAAVTEKQLLRQVALNLEIKRLSAERVDLIGPVFRAIVSSIVYLPAGTKLNHDFTVAPL